MLDWLRSATKVFGPIGRRLVARWLFEAEFLSGSRSVHTFENGNSPFVNIGISIRAHDETTRQRPSTSAA
jgi:hypothetical protein